MKPDGRMIAVFVALALVAGFWFALLSPKRGELAELDKQATELEASVAQHEQVAAAAVEAQDDYEANYHRLVVLGKAVPGDDDTPSLMVEISALARKAGIEFRSLAVSSEGATAEAPATAAAETTADGSEGSEPAESTSSVPAAPATEAAAATLPIGATVGPAGLPVLPYDLSFEGDFFEIAKFMAGLDKLVQVDKRAPGVDGRLITVNAFALTPDPDKGLPHLTADLNVTTFLSPTDQGTTGGATPAAPPAAVAADPVPVATP